MKYLRVKNLERYQHYKERRPPWVKLHRTILEDYDFGCLQDASKLHAILLVIIASECDNALPDNAAWLGKRLCASDPVNIDALVSAGFLERYERLQDASTLLANAPESLSPEYRVQSTENRVQNPPPASAVAERDTPAKPAASVPMPAPTPARITWLTPVRVAYESGRGAGSFATLAGQAAKALRPLVDAGHSVEFVARCLDYYLRRKRAESRRLGKPAFESITQFAQTFADWNPDELVGEDGLTDRERGAA